MLDVITQAFFSPIILCPTQLNSLNFHMFYNIAVSIINAFYSCIMIYIATFDIKKLKRYS